MNKMEHLKRIKQENAWREMWIHWVRSKDMLNRAEMEFCRDAYHAGFKAGEQYADE